MGGRHRGASLNPEVEDDGIPWWVLPIGHNRSGMLEWAASWADVELRPGGLRPGKSSPLFFLLSFLFYFLFQLSNLNLNLLAGF
jgi:hypothetical protein